MFNLGGRGTPTGTLKHSPEKTKSINIITIRCSIAEPNACTIMKPIRQAKVSHLQP